MDVAESSLLLIDDQGEALLAFSIDAMALQTLKGYLQVCAETPVHKQLKTSLSAAMDAAIQQAIPYHIRRPSEAQLSYALGIARALDISIPPEALSQRWAMHEFLDCHVESYRLRQAAKAKGLSTTSACVAASVGARSSDIDEPHEGEAPSRFE